MARYLITGGAGFIGSHLAAALAASGHAVRVIDNLSTGRREKLDGIEAEFIQGDILDTDALAGAMAGQDYCLHLAALPSVPRSIQDPRASNRANVEGSINVFLAARDAGVKRVVYASSSSVYGNAATMPLVETLPRQPLSPYAVSKATVEWYAASFQALYGIELVGLRYFNVFGPRQDPDSPYAAVIPKFIRRILAGEAPEIYGDGKQARDFTFVDNVVSANLKACAAGDNIGGIYNVACGDSISLLDLCGLLGQVLHTRVLPVLLPPRAGDIRRSWADITAARAAFGYEPVVAFEDGLRRTADSLR
ncbi:MAG: NAD-dependent epimerase/dehydratase family protein [Candidatus Hydrogenedens sp.]|nr:NAD-dependent epimerase/dehydratase family protein [Candidatus Hydrogenedens sp.]